MGNEDEDEDDDDGDDDIRRWWWLLFSGGWIRGCHHVYDLFSLVGKSHSSYLFISSMSVHLQTPDLFLTRIELDHDTRATGLTVQYQVIY